MSRAKLDFFTYASHEIRTQLTLISVPLEKLSQKLKADTEVSQQLDQIKHQTSRLTHLVRELLDFRKAEPQNLPLLPKRLNLQPFLKEICLSFEETAKLNRIHFSYHLTSVEAVVDSRQLEKVFFNLISNAIKFTPAEGKVELHMLVNQGNVQI